MCHAENPQADTNKNRIKKEGKEKKPKRKSPPVEWNVGDMLAVAPETTGDGEFWICKLEKKFSRGSEYLVSWFELTSYKGLYH